jgi:exopolysaccharide production protein ExoZ
MNRIESIQFLRGIAAFAVVIFHACLLSVDYAGGIVYQPGLVIGKAGVDLFFVISGFVMISSTYDRFDDPSIQIRFIIQRVSRIFPPYWILSTAVLAYYLYNPSGVNAEHGGVDVIASYLLLPSDKSPLVPVAWTLVHEMIFYMIFFFGICMLPKKWLLQGLIGWAFLAATNSLIGHHTADLALKTILLHPFNLEFIGGALIGLLYKQKGLPTKNASITYILCSLSIFGLAALYFQSTGTQGIPDIIRIVLFGAPSMLLLLGCLGLDFKQTGIFGFFTRMGYYSYSLYLIHILIIHLAYRIITKKFGITLTLETGALLATTLVASSVLAGYIFYRLVEKPSCSYVAKKLNSMQHRKKMNFKHETEKLGA